MYSLIHIHVDATTQTTFTWTYLHPLSHTQASLFGHRPCLGFNQMWVESEIGDNQGLIGVSHLPSPGLDASDSPGFRSATRLSQKHLEVICLCFKKTRGAWIYGKAWVVCSCLAYALLCA